LKNIIKHNGNAALVIKILIAGLLVVGLIYFIYPVDGQFTMMINGEPVVDPIAQFATLPVFLAVIVFTGVFFVLAFLGAGLFVFLAAFLFILFGVFMIAPYVWPLLLVIFIIVSMMLLNEKTSTKA